jgi:thiol:disulfide interchange protein
LTFSLTSFACIGPFAGTLLASSLQASAWVPVVGMAVFAAGLATPFFGLALFPAYLQRLPRSGSWLARVKTVAGFVILAMMFKYLASVDQVLQLHVLSRERFLAIWFALSLVSALYLLGQLRLPGSHETETVGLGRVLAGIVFVAFAMSLLPGMFGANLGEIESFLPPPDGRYAQRGPSAAPTGPAWIENDLAGAIAKARNEHKTLLVSFSGYACTNCHWMKANLFRRAEVALALQDFVLVELYTDGTDEASKRNQAIEESRFSTVALPFYAVLDSDERVLATRAGLVRSSSEFLSFLHYRPAGS